jgi:hypothetical protein
MYTTISNHPDRWERSHELKPSVIVVVEGGENQKKII